MCCKNSCIQMFKSKIDWFKLNFSHSIFVLHAQHDQIKSDWNFRMSSKQLINCTERSENNDVIRNDRVFPQLPHQKSISIGK